MTQQETLKLLERNGYEFKQGGNSSFIAKKDNATITIHSNAKVQVQGKNKDTIETEINKILKNNNDVGQAEEKQLFIVYGHDKTSQDQLSLFLRQLDIKTIQVTNNTGTTIIEALEQEISRVHAGIILLTPDDICISQQDYEKHKPDIEGYIHKRARQNVVLEMGMIMAKIGRENTIILAKDGVEIPSDIEGVFRLQFKEHIKEIHKKLAERLEKCGFVIDKNKFFDAIE